MFGTSGSALPSVFLSSVSSLLVPLCLLHPPLSVYLLHLLLSSLSLLPSLGRLLAHLWRSVHWLDLKPGLSSPSLLE